MENLKRVRDASLCSVTPETANALRSGDHDAYKTLYYAYSGSLLGFLTKLLGSASDGEEVLQDVFIKIWENRGRIDPSKNIKSYIYTIAKNSALKYMKSRMAYEWMDDGFDMAAAPGNVADQEIIAQETRILIDIAVSNMPENRRRVFLLHEEGLSYEEIADRLKITQSNARMQLMRARKDIKEIISLILFFMLT